MINQKDFKQTFEDEKLMWDCQRIESGNYKCGYCGYTVVSEQGMGLKSNSSKVNVYVYICTNCYLPTLFYENESHYYDENEVMQFKDDHEQIPCAKIARSFEKVPEDINKIYEEARNCYSIGAYTAVTLLCRKLLMHVAVNLGAKEESNFRTYVEYLSDNNYITKNSGKWVDRIGRMGNDSNHEIKISSQDEASMIIRFCEMFLATNYEYDNE